MIFINLTGNYLYHKYKSFKKNNFILNLLVLVNLIVFLKQGLFNYFHFAED
jgi:hypothetical protein